MTRMWRAIGASVAGTSHLRSGQPCQDAYHYTTLADGTLVAAVADGAGSAAMGETGAKISVQQSVSVVAASLGLAFPQTFYQWQYVFEETIRQTQAAIHARAIASEQAPRDYASTLLIVVAQPSWVVCGAIGDCAAIIQDKYRNLESLCPPQRGEYANATHFVTDPDASDQLKVRLRSFPRYADNTEQSQLGRLCSIALLTDGLLELALNVAHNRPFAPFFEPLFAFAADVAEGNEDAAAQDLAAFLESERVTGRTHDDKTLLLLRNVGRRT